MMKAKNEVCVKAVRNVRTLLAAQKRPCLRVVLDVYDLDWERGSSTCTYLGEHVDSAIGVGIKSITTHQRNDAAVWKVLPV